MAAKTSKSVIELTVTAEKLTVEKRRAALLSLHRTLATSNEV
jgi:hypothetical protein